MSSVSSPQVGGRECERCSQLKTLCRSCKRSILPQLAQPGWIRLIGQNNGGKDKKDESSEGRRVRLRKERKAVRRLLRAGPLALLSRLA